MVHIGVVIAVVVAGCGRVGFDPCAAPSGADGTGSGSGSGGGSAVAVAQAAADGCGGCSSSSVALPGNVAASDLLIAFLYTCAPTDAMCPSPTIADTLGNTWTGPLVHGSTGQGADYVFYACGARAGADTITATNGNAVYGMVFHVQEVAGVASSACLDTSGTKTGTGVLASVTTDQPLAGSNDYVVGFFANNSSGGASSYNAGAGATMLTVALDSALDVAMTEKLPVGPAGAPATATAGVTRAAATWQAMILAFLGS